MSALVMAKSLLLRRGWPVSVYSPGIVTETSLSCGVAGPGAAIGAMAHSAPHTDPCAARWQQVLAQAQGHMRQQGAHRGAAALCPTHALGAAVLGAVPGRRLCPPLRDHAQLGAPAVRF